MLVVLSLLSPQASAAVCPNVDLETSTVGPAMATGDTSVESADWLPTCGAADPLTGDYAVEFTAPTTGYYVFDTDGSAYDTTISLFSTADCTTSLGCDDDGGYSVQSSIGIDLLSGESVVVVVDGFLDNAGPFVLNGAYFPPQVCTLDTDLGMSLGNALSTGTTCGAVNDVERASCGGGQESEDLVFAWQAPATDLFTIDTNGSTYDTALTVRDTNCAELYCDDDGGDSTQSQVIISATAGTTYNIVVDGFGSSSCGDYVLSINQGCPDADNDGVCDADDVCDGDDYSGDSDSDGVCDDIDACLGDDFTGDDDGDGICNDTDFVQADPDPTAGDFLFWRVNNAPPGANILFLASVAGTGAGPCLPMAPVCVDLLNPKLAGSDTADVNGTAVLAVRVPPARQGETAYFQAVWVQDGNGDKTEVDSAVIQ